MKRGRVFGGRKFYYWADYGTKREARKEAGKLRSAGDNARITEAKGGYVVWRASSWR